MKSASGKNLPWTVRSDTKTCPHKSTAFQAETKEAQTSRKRRVFGEFWHPKVAHRRRRTTIRLFWLTSHFSHFCFCFLSPQAASCVALSLSVASSSSSSSSLFMQAPLWWTTGPWDHLPLLAPAGSHIDARGSRHTLGSAGSLSPSPTPLHSDLLCSAAHYLALLGPLSHLPDPHTK